MQKLRNLRMCWRSSKNHTLSIKEELRRRLANVRIPVENDPEDALGLVYHVRDDTLHFEVNKAQLSSQGAAFLQQFTPPLASVLSSPSIFREVRLSVDRRSYGLRTAMMSIICG